MIRWCIPGALAALLLVASSAGPAQAMCGGNIFMTCPPSASSTKPQRERKLREPRQRRHGAASGKQGSSAGKPAQ